MMVPFDEVFVLADTIALDPSILIGRISDVDADESGNVLITDRDSRLVHLLDSGGHHITTLDWEVCYPSDSGERVFEAQFADDGSIIVATWGRQVVVFDRSGNCLAAKTVLRWFSFCTWGDSIFTYRGLQGLERNALFEVYTMDLALQRTIEMASPEFPRLNSSNLGLPGHLIACFRGGPLYKHLEYMDGKPISGQKPWTLVRPEFFEERKTDVPVLEDFVERAMAIQEFPTLEGLFALENDVRMMLFFGIDESYRLEGDTRRLVQGLSIASNNNRFEPISTVPPSRNGIAAARYGHLYFVGRSTPTPDGDVSNSPLIRYRFIQPTSD